MLHPQRGLNGCCFFQFLGELTDAFPIVPDHGEFIHNPIMGRSALFLYDLLNGWYSFFAVF